MNIIEVEHVQKYTYLSILDLKHKHNMYPQLQNYN